MFAALKRAEGLSFYASIAHTCATLSGCRPLFPAMQDSSFIAMTDLSAIDTLLSMASDLVT